MLEEKKQSVTIFLGKLPSRGVKMVLHVAALSYPNSGLSVLHIAFINAQMRQMIATWIIVSTTKTGREGGNLTTATTLLHLANLIWSKMTKSKERVSI